MSLVHIPPRLPIVIDGEALAAIAERHQVQELALFGSVLRDDFTPASDVDVLVTFRPGVLITLFTLGGVVTELQMLLGRRVDLVLEDAIKPFLREEILSSKEVIYVYSSQTLGDC